MSEGVGGSGGRGEGAHARIKVQDARWFGVVGFGPLPCIPHERDLGKGTLPRTPSVWPQCEELSGGSAPDLFSPPAASPCPRGGEIRSSLACMLCAVLGGGGGGSLGPRGRR